MTCHVMSCLSLPPRRYLLPLRLRVCTHRQLAVRQSATSTLQFRYHRVWNIHMHAYIMRISDHIACTHIPCTYHIRHAHQHACRMLQLGTPRGDLPFLTLAPVPCDRAVLMLCFCFCFCLCVCVCVCVCMYAMITVFQIMTPENWNEIVADAITQTSWAAVLYFIPLMLIGHCKWAQQRRHERAKLHVIMMT